MRFAAALFLLASVVCADEFNTPFPAHKVIGNIYYVGTRQLSSYLITTPEGHILINSDMEETLPLLRASVEKLKFKFTDIKIILGSHAHYDHMDGDAVVKAATGGKVMAMEQDLPWLRKMTPGGKPHPVDRVLHDGDTVALGGSTLTAHLTPGHSPGCTTWSMKVREGNRDLDAVIVCSVGVNPEYHLVNNKEYPQIADDYRKSFRVLRAMPCDVFLGAHGLMYGMEEKYARIGKPGPNPFIDPNGYRAFLDEYEKRFQARLAEQQK